MQKNSFVIKILLRVSIMFLIIVSIIMGFFFYSLKKVPVSTSIKNAKNTIQQFKVLRGYYTRNIVGKVKKHTDLQITFDHKQVERSIPLPATMIHDLSQLFQEGEGSQLKLYSEFPFPNRKSRKLDQFARDALKYFKDNANTPNLKPFDQEKIIEGKQFIRVAIADKMVAPACVSCHNSHPDTPKNDWKLGDTRGVLEVILPIEEQIQSTNSILYMGIGIFLFLGFLFVLFLYLLLKSITKKSLHDVQIGAHAISQGNLDIQFSTQSNDEFGELNQAFGTMTQSIRNKVLLAEKIAQGDLSVEINLLSKNDSLGKALQTMSVNLNQLLFQISSASQQLTIKSQQLSNSSHVISQGITEQSSSLEELTVSMEEINAQTIANASNAKQTNQLAISARERAEEGNEHMKLMLESMKEINNASENISNIIKTIDEIAFQTNVLAINAAVEAARAGIHGKGFAVVAEEVRSLAQRSASAAKETTSIIKDSLKKVESGAKIADKTAVFLEEIVNSSTKVTDLVNEIASASNEQARGISEINNSLLQLNQVTQQNAHAVEKSALANKELNHQSVNLRQIVARFKLQKRSRSPQSNSNFSYAPSREELSNLNAASSFPVEPSPPEIPMKTSQKVETAGTELISFDEEDTGKF